MTMMILAETGLLQAALTAGLTMLGLGALFALVLLVASILLKVQVDPKIEAVQAALPGVDCGACGMAGCASYAKAVVNNPELLGKCAPGGPETSAKIAEILNLQVSGGGPPLRPIVHCRGQKQYKLFFSEYSGIQSCTAANACANVQACKYGCMGFGDCVRSCKFDALHIIEGLATVDYEKCTGCGACAKACPRNLIEMVPFPQDLMMTVACNSIENGKTTKQFCQVGCIGCKLCTKQSELFSVEDNLAKLDHEKYQPSEAFETAMTKCPTSVIVYRGKGAPVDPGPKKK